MTQTNQRHVTLRLLALTAVFGIAAMASGQAQAQKVVNQPQAVQNLNVVKINPSVLKSLGNLNANGGTTTTNVAGVPEGNPGKGVETTCCASVRTVVIDGSTGRDLPRRGDDPKDTPVVERSGEPRNLGQLQAVSSIGQLSQAPLQRIFDAPRQTTLNKLENRVAASLAASSANTAGPANRDQALKALDGAKPLI